jgi:S-adenosylmethionine-diacylglycerol 3-amino-3-carboxypropyl transferase
MSGEERTKRPGAAGIRYAQCWEDPRALDDALAVTPDDDVVSIASGGDNTLGLLLKGPRSVTAVDFNPVQLHLVELKIRAVEHLDYEEFVAFVGARPSGERLETYGKLRPSLSGVARDYWEGHPDALAGGIIHCGKFERYFGLFRRRILPLIHGRRTVRRLLASPRVEEQREFYRRTWDNRRWRLLFRAFFGKFLLGRLGRDPAHFRYVTLDNVAATLLGRTRHALTEIPIRDNFYVEYILTGNYGRLDSGPPWLRPENFAALKANVGRVRLVRAGLTEYLASLAPGSASKFNLSDVFEYLSDAEVEVALREVCRVSVPAGRLAFWTVFVRHPVPESLQDRLRPMAGIEDKWPAEARAFFYGSFGAWDIRP